MIVLGVAPGLRSLAYAVLSFRDGSRAAEVVDADVLKASGQSDEASVWAVTRSARVHALVMGVVFDRDPPALLSLGPPTDLGEPALHVEVVCKALTMLAMAIGARIARFPTEPEVRSALGSMYEQEVGPRSLRKAVQCSLLGRLPTTNRRVLVATATAIAGAYQARTELIGPLK